MTATHSVVGRPQIQGSRRVGTHIGLQPIRCTVWSAMSPKAVLAQLRKVKGAFRLLTMNYATEESLLLKAPQIGQPGTPQGRASALGQDEPPINLIRPGDDRLIARPARWPEPAAIGGRPTFD